MSSLLPTSRPSWDETWLEVARVVARRSLCVRDQVGAVVVDPTNRIVATGYNGPPAGFPLSLITTSGGWHAGVVDQSPSCVTWCRRAGSLCTCDHLEVDHTGAHESPTACGRCGCWGFEASKLPTVVDYSDCPSLHAEANALSVCDRSTRENGTIYVTSQVCFPCAKLIANSGLVQVVVRPTADYAHRNAQVSYEFMERCGITVVTAPIPQDVI